MSGTDWSVLGGVFLGGAIPWLEAVVVIPVGILAGAPAVAVVLSGVLGNLLTVALAAWAGERIRGWWVRRRAGKQAQTHRPEPAEPEVATERAIRRRERIERVMSRWGMPGLALVGPLGLGTQVSAVVAVAAGVGAMRSFVWVGAGTVLWSAIAAVLASAGLSFAGIGA